MVGALSGEIARFSGKLANPDVVARASEKVVEENRERPADAEGARETLQGRCPGWWGLRRGGGW